MSGIRSTLGLQKGVLGTASKEEVIKHAEDFIHENDFQKNKNLTPTQGERIIVLFSLVGIYNGDFN